MGVVAVAAKHLIAAGVTGDALVTALEEIEAAVDVRRLSSDAVERKRARDREYQRERRTAASMSDDCQTTSSDMPLTYLDSPKKEEPKEEKKVSKTRGSRLSDDYPTISDEWRAAAKALGATDSEIDKWYPEFVDYWVAVPGHRGVKLDWLRTWQGNVRRKIEWRGKSNGRLEGASRTGSKSVSAAARALAERLAGEEDRNVVLRIPEGRLPRPGGLFGPNGNSPEPVSIFGGRVCDGPADGDSTAAEIPPKYRGSGGGV